MSSFDRKVVIYITEITADRVEQLKQNIINSTVGEDAIDNGDVEDLTDQLLIKEIFNLGLSQLESGLFDFVYDEEHQKWIIERRSLSYGKIEE